jgi:serine phosphatase RsbU (regulator of sigma subunit)
VQVVERTLGELLRAADAGPVDALPEVVRRVFARFDVRGVVLYLSDYDETLLRPAPGSVSTEGSPTAVDVEGTNAGRAYRERKPYEHTAGDVHRMWVPVLERAEPLGVLLLELGDIDDDIRRTATEMGIAIGHLLMTARKYTDVYELLRRRRDMNIAAEMHWDVLPARNYVGPAVSICGDLEPAYEVGGDAFDYSINDKMLDVCILDAMGHGGEAALLSTQAVAAYRYARRRHFSLEEIARVVDGALIERFSGERFVTGVFGRLDVPTGRFGWVNAGHDAPLLLREGRVQTALEKTPNCPLGLELLEEVRTYETRMQPGDCLMFYSDGVVQAKDPAGVHFALDRLVDLIEGHIASGGPVGALVHLIISAVMRHSSGPLHDDATILLVELREHRS